MAVYPIVVFTNSVSLPAINGSIIRKQWLKIPHSWLNLSAILTFTPPNFFVW
jgi:hypothetical protein